MPCCQVACVGCWKNSVQGVFENVLKEKNNFYALSLCKGPLLRVMDEDHKDGKGEEEVCTADPTKPTFIGFM